MPDRPSDWTPANETDYQMELAKLKAQIAELTKKPDEKKEPDK